ncbi:MAG: hypothetical protein JWR22_2183 [Herminiimonas sp.]|nr:hypothetical protein [Herminiimonas sp.]
MQVRDPKPEIMRLEELALLVKSGEIKLPRFQRPFVWKESDMLKLLDSIYRGYPIGSILIWNSSQSLRSERSILGLEVDVNRNISYPTNYLLDGQQRLTTLCGALFWDGSDDSSKWNIHFDLEAEEFVYPRRRDSTTLFPLNRLIDTRDFIRQCMKFDGHDRRDTFFDVSERLLKSIKDYKIAVVKIGDMTIEEVAPIFERINSTGRKLTMVDLMMAATWSNGFDLTDSINRIKESCAQEGFEDVGDQIILRSIAASAGLGVNKDDIQKLREKTPSELLSAAEHAARALHAALSFLKTRLGILDFGYIPYGFQLTHLTELFRLNPELSENQADHLVQWFWFTSVTRYFGATNTGQVTRDLNAMRAYAMGRRDRLFDIAEIDISRLLFDKFNLRNATSITFTVLLNARSPNRTINGRAIDGSHLKVKSSKFFSCFAPLSAEYRNLNFTRIIYPYPDSDGLELSEHYVELEENLLDPLCVEFRGSEMADQFLLQRCNIVAHLVERLTGCAARFSANLTPSQDLDDSDEDGADQ